MPILLDTDQWTTPHKQKYGTKPNWRNLVPMLVEREFQLIGGQVAAALESINEDREEKDQSVVTGALAVRKNQSEPAWNKMETRHYHGFQFVHKQIITIEVLVLLSQNGRSGIQLHAYSTWEWPMDHPAQAQIRHQTQLAQPCVYVLPQLHP